MITKKLFFCNNCGEIGAEHVYKLNERPDILLCNHCNEEYWTYINWRSSLTAIHTMEGRHPPVPKGVIFWDIVNEH